MLKVAGMGQEFSKGPRATQNIKYLRSNIEQMHRAKAKRT